MFVDVSSAQPTPWTSFDWAPTLARSCEMLRIEGDSDMELPFHQRVCARARSHKGGNTTWDEKPGFAITQISVLAPRTPLVLVL